MKLDALLINIQCYSQNHKTAFFGPPYGGNSVNTSALYKSFNASKLCSSFIERMPVLLVKQRVSVSEPPFVGGLWVTYTVCDAFLVSWKARNRLPIGYNCTFC